MKRSSVIGLAVAAITLTTGVAHGQTAPVAPEAPTPPAVEPSKAPSEATAPRQAPVAIQAPAAPPAAVPLQGLSDTSLPPNEELLAAPPTPPAAGTKLNLRTPSDKPLELAPEPAGEGLMWKLLAGTALLGAAAFAMKKKGLLGKAVAKGLAHEEPPSLRVLARTTLAQKGELVVASVDGQRFLLGVTGQSIVRLAMLSPDGVEDETIGFVPASPQPEETIVPGVEFERLLGAVAAADKPALSQDPRKATPPPTVRRAAETVAFDAELDQPIDRVIEEAIGEPVVAREIPAPASSRPRVRTRAARAYAPKAASHAATGGTQALSLKQLRQRRAG